MRHRKRLQSILFLCFSAMLLTVTVFAQGNGTAVYHRTLTISAGGADYVLPARETVYNGVSTDTVDLTPLGELTDAYRAEAARELLLQLGYAEGAASLQEESLQNLVTGMELNITRQYETRKGHGYIAVAQTRVNTTQHFILGFVYGLDPDSAWRLYVTADQSFSVTSSSVRLSMRYETEASADRPAVHEISPLGVNLVEDELLRYCSRIGDGSLQGQFGSVLYLAFLQDLRSVFLETSFFCAANTVHDPANTAPRVFGGLQVSTIDEAEMDRYVGAGLPAGDHLVTADHKITVDFPHGFGIKIYDRYPACRLHD